MGLSGDADQFCAIQRTGGGARMPWPEAEGGDIEHFYLQMNGTSVFKHAVVGFAEQIEQTLARENLKPGDIAWVVPHQANARILTAVSKRVGIPYDRFVMTISKYGNTSAASVSMALAGPRRRVSSTTATRLFSAASARADVCGWVAGVVRFSLRENLA